ncbi:hypothetical protein E2C01_059745 [Portunus trituberculatus]|uniref:Uncharacterized protein n=1 Tax=Portunus trituberculatus TaxID=210409 RepID=A0A5B7H8N1_PORTR|nr:hypothetical protein [Portunus trituberculatus]
MVSSLSPASAWEDDAAASVLRQRDNIRGTLAWRHNEGVGVYGGAFPVCHSNNVRLYSPSHLTTSLFLTPQSPFPPSSTLPHPCQSRHHTNNTTTHEEVFTRSAIIITTTTSGSQTPVDSSFDVTRSCIFTRS